MAIPALAVIGLASAVYSIWESHQQTPEQRDASRGRHRAMFWGGLAGAFAAGTPLVAGMGKFGGYSAASQAGGAGGAAASTSSAAATTTATEAAVASGGEATAVAGANAATVSTEPIITTGAAETQAAAAAAETVPEYTVGLQQAGGPGAPTSVKISAWSDKIQSFMKSTNTGQSFMPQQQQQQPAQQPQPARRQPVFTDFYQDDQEMMSMQEDVISDDSRRGALRHTWWEA